jgi:hypothetical protein
VRIVTYYTVGFALWDHIKCYQSVNVIKFIHLNIPQLLVNLRNIPFFR